MEHDNVANDVAALIAEYDDGSFSPSWKWCRLAAAMLRRLSAQAGRAWDDADAAHKTARKSWNVSDSLRERANAAGELLREVLEDQSEANWSMGSDWVDRARRALAAQDKDANG